MVNRSINDKDKNILLTEINNIINNLIEISGISIEIDNQIIPDINNINFISKFKASGIINITIKITGR